MGVTKTLLTNGNGSDKPKPGDEVTIQYTGCLYDASKTDKHCMGTEFDSSRNRGDFNIQIGVGKVIKGWDEGVVSMSLGERSILTISADYGYGDHGFPGLIPPNSTLVFDVQLKGINGKKA